MNVERDSFDVAIIGAGTAALSAALVLGRSRVSTLVLDGGETRNATAPAAHNLFSRDGATPAELLRIGREQLVPYPTVQVRNGFVTSAKRVTGGFEVVCGDLEPWNVKKLVLATGLTDDYPLIEGFRERWGITVVHCPFCHGWEVRDKTLAIYGNGPTGFDLCLLAKNWSDRLTLCTDGPADFTEEQRERLSANGIPILENKVVRVEGQGTSMERVVFADRESLSCEALFVRSIRRQRSELAWKLGCAFTDEGFIDVDEMGQTSVEGAYAAGDAIESNMQILPFASYSGARAGIGVSKALIYESFG